MKKILILLTALILAVCALVACGGDGDGEGTCKHENTMINPAVPTIVSTCVQKGQTGETICRDCGAVLKENVEDEKINSDAHPAASLVAIAPKEATCSAAGNGPGVKCSLCEKVTVIPTQIPMLAHTPIAYPDVAATLHNEGHTGGTHCSVCATILEAPTVIPALKTGHEHADVDTPGTLSHIVTTVAALAPTCTAVGHRAEVICTICQAAGNPHVIQATSEIPATGHLEENYVVTAGKEYVPATCVAVGYTAEITCSACGGTVQERQEIPIDATNHPTANWVVAAPVAAGCGQLNDANKTRTETGKHAGVNCSACNGVVLAQADDTRYPDHAFVKSADRVEPNCATATPGVTVQMTCSKCGFIEGGEEIEPEHDLKEVEAAIEPNCATGADGKTAVLGCQNEGCTYTEGGEVVPHEHDMKESEAAVAPNCDTETNGTTAKSACQNEGCTHTEGGETVAWAHTPGEWTTVTEATETTAGEKKTNCTVCNKEYTEVIPATGTAAQ